MISLTKSKANISSANNKGLIEAQVAITESPNEQLNDPSATKEDTTMSPNAATTVNNQPVFLRPVKKIQNPYDEF